MYIVRPYLKVGGDLFREYQPYDAVAFYDDPIYVWAVDAFDAAEKVFAVGNRVNADERGTTWREDTRSLSVGDVLAVMREGDDESCLYLACQSLGWKTIPGTSVPMPVPMRGSSATSRV